MYISFTSFLAQHICFLSSSRSRFLSCSFSICFAPFQFIFLLSPSLTKNECVSYSFQRFRSIQWYDTRAFYVLFQLFPRATLNVQFYIASICICAHVCTQHTQRFHALTFLCIISKAHTQSMRMKKRRKKGCQPVFESPAATSKKNLNKLRIPCMCCKYFYFNIVRVIFYFLFKSNQNNRFNFVFSFCFYFG